MVEIDELLALEIKVWDALVAGDADADHALLAADFVGVYPSGFSDRAGHVDQLATGPSIGSYLLSDAQVVVMSEVAAMVIYRAAFRRPGVAEDVAPEEMFVSSLWCLRDHRWVNVFSQDTPTGSS